MSAENAKRLRAVADYIRWHGFTPELGWDGAPRCFAGAALSIGWCPAIGEDRILCEVLGVEYSYFGLLPESLRANGWMRGQTNDAAAACEIAADLES